MVLTHSRALKTRGNTAVIEADLREPQAILDHPGTRELVDFTQPLAVLLVAVLHFLSEKDSPSSIVATIRDAFPAGSYLVISHVTGDIRSEPAAWLRSSTRRWLRARRCAGGRRSCDSSTG